MALWWLTHFLATCISLHSERHELLNKGTPGALTSFKAIQIKASHLCQIIQILNSFGFLDVFIMHHQDKNMYIFTIDTLKNMIKTLA